MGERGTGRPTVLGLFDWKPQTGSGAGLLNPEQPLPYRADLLPSSGRLDLRVVRPASTRVHRKVRDVVEHRSGVTMDLLLRAVPRAASSQAVLAFLEHQLTSLSWARRHRLRPYSAIPAMGIACWWAEELASGQRDPRQVAEIVAGIDRLFVFSRNQREIFERAGVPREKVRPVLFGADHRFFTPVEAEPRFDAVAVGVDRGRDWHTLVEAARRLPSRRFDVFTGPGRIVGPDLPSNLTVHEPVGFTEYREVLRTARVVVVPTFDLAYPVGQSVLLEAMASGRCTVVTGTSAMADYTEDGRTSLAITPGDPQALARAVDDALGDDSGREMMGRAARLAVEERFTFDHLWRTIGEEILEEIA